LWFIRIRTKYRDSGDVGIVRHELEHVRQFWTRGLLIHPLRYRFSESYRLKCEVEAYKEQLKWFPAKDNIEHYRDMYAGFISSKDSAIGYNLSITKDEVVELLSCDPPI
jgi:hypothetical protein